MACGCKKKKPAPPSLENIVYEANGADNHVRLGLKPFFALPIRLPQAIDGRDVIIVKSTSRIPSEKQGAYVVVGRNALMEKQHRQQMVDKWPQAFRDV